MTKSDWIRKVKAFLVTSPDASLFLPEDEEWAKDLIATALGITAGEIDLSELSGVKELAEGLDIPPFVKQFSTDIFLDKPVFKHPLSGEEIKLDLRLTEIDKDKTKVLIKESINEIRDEIKKQKEELPPEELHKRLFFTLWRKLPDVIRQREEREIVNGVKIGKYWDWLPADPRIPTHSVWEHSSIVSAIAGTNSEPALLIFTIASPQQFISTARRTQDSWMGSFLLSFLMWEAVKYIADEFGPDCFLFPGLRRQPLVDRWLETQKGISISTQHEESVFQIANFPNVLTAILPEAEATCVAEKAKEKMTEKWKEIALCVREKVEKATERLKINPGAVWGQIWKRQIENFLSQQGIFWAVCPWQDGEKDAIEACEKLFSQNGYISSSLKHEHSANLRTLTKTVLENGGEINSGMMYQAVSTIASRALTARKNLRDFQNKKEEGERCTLCGVREAVHPEFDGIKKRIQDCGENLKPTEYNLLHYFWRKLGDVEFYSSGEKIKFKGRIKRGDLLCAVCLVKRLALEHYFDKKRDNGFHFKNYHLFPSTSSISTAPFKGKVIDSLKDEKTKEALKEYNEKVSKFLDKIGLVRESSAVPKLESKITDKYRDLINEFLRLDGQWLFKESFWGQEVETEIKNKSGEKVKLEDLREKAVASLEKLLKLFKEKPSRYYAVISMDGDEIGKWLKGTNAPVFKSLFHPLIADKLKKDSIFDEKRPLGAISHLSLSIALKNFALEVAPFIVERQHYGKLIYAGGDDLIAFVPTENLLRLIEQLRMFFQGEKTREEISISDFEAENGVVCVAKRTNRERDFLAAGAATDKDSDRPTVSIGAAIIHNSYPLSQAIEEAFVSAMKEHAKKKLGRDAVAIHLNKRAGSPLKVGFKWSDSETENIAGILQKIVGYYKDESLSSRLGYELNLREIGLEGDWKDFGDPGEKPWWRDAQKQVLRRLVKRHTTEGKRAEIQAQLDLLLETIFTSYENLFRSLEKKSDFNLAAKEMEKRKIDTGWLTLTKMLLLTRFLAGDETEESKK